MSEYFDPEARRTEEQRSAADDLESRRADETQQQVNDAVAGFAADFGYDLDEEGEPLEEAAAA